MQSSVALVFLVCLGSVCAQIPESPETIRAQQTFDRLKALVDAGAAPRAQLEQAEVELADARDAAFLRRTLYGQDLTEDQADEMLAAAARRVDRRKQTLEQGRKLVSEGVASQLSLGAFLEELDRARKEYDLAVSRAKLTEELAEMARAEQALDSAEETSPEEAGKVAQRFDGLGMFTAADFSQVRRAFEAEFERSLPVSAVGETAVHRALGFDHRNRVDVAIHPDQPEGVWLRRYLESRKIPYFAFRRAVSGKATAAHIHIGPMSGRIVRGG